MLLTTREAAIMLCLRPGTLKALRCRGGGPEFIRVGTRTVRYRRSDLLEYIARRRMDTTRSPSRR